MDREKSRAHINTKEDLDWLVSLIKEGKRFARNFIFDDKLFDAFFHDMKISQEEFFEKRYYYDAENNIHISWCIDGDIDTCGLWISTYGLACYKKEDCENIFVNSLYSHRVTMSLLIREAKELVRIDETYDTTGQYDYLRDLAQAYYHNMLFFYELVGKCYLAYCNVKIRKTHKLSEILKLVKRTMFQEKHNDSLFHLYIVHDLQETVNHIGILPPNFREEFVKYHDNEDDNTLIVFNGELLNEMERVVDLGCEYVTSLSYYKKVKGEYFSFLTQGIYQKKIEKATDAEDRKKREAYFKFLIEESSSEED